MSKRARDKPAPLSRGEYVAAKQAQVAAWFGVTLSTVRFWSCEGMPGRPGHYDLAAISRWRLAQLDRRSRDSADDHDDEAKRKLNEIKARSAEIDLRGKEQSYVPMHYVRDILDHFVVAMTRAQHMLGTRYGGQAHETMDICLEDMHSTRAAFDRDFVRQ